jgi:anaerobic magnesium-protoporphyrin IX monomethyl ester cyclase
MSPPAILLVNPRICRRRNARLPLSLLSLAAAVGGKARPRIVDGNFEDDAGRSVLAALGEERPALVGITVMPGPQIGPAIAISRVVKARFPDLPVVWGGYFPTLYPGAAINAPYVDVVVRGPGEETLPELVALLSASALASPLSSGTNRSVLRAVPGITWKDAGTVVHNADRAFRPPDELSPYPYELLGDVSRFLQPTFLGRRTAVHQAAIGCRYRCSFCGVVSMFDGKTLLPAAARVATDLRVLKERYGADAVQFYDHNFFDREETTTALLEALAPLGLPYWCYARPDALAGFSEKMWTLVKRSGMKMVFMGAEAASDEALRRMQKGTRVDQTLEAARRCREAGIVPEFSFVLGGPGDSEGEIDTTLLFIRRLKRVHPGCEVILYFWTPTPRRDPRLARGASPLALARLPGREGEGTLELPTTPEEWAEPEWVNFVCHREAPWLSVETRRRVAEFAAVLGCRFPTVQDVRLPRWGKALLAGAASWRWATHVYSRPLELQLLRKVIPLKRPEEEGL